MPRPVLTAAGRRADDKRAVRARLPLLAACVIIIVLILGVGYAIGQYVPRQARATAEKTSKLVLAEQQDRKTLVASCIRGNQLKAALNKSNGANYKSELANYLAFSAVTSGERGLAKGSATKQPNSKVLDAHHKLEIQVANDIVAAARTAKRAAENVQFQPYTNCLIAANHPQTYRLKPSIPWSQHLTEILSAKESPNPTH